METFWISSASALGLSWRTVNKRVLLLLLLLNYSCSCSWSMQCSARHWMSPFYYQCFINSAAIAYCCVVAKWLERRLVRWLVIIIIT